MQVDGGAAPGDRGGGAGHRGARPRRRSRRSMPSWASRRSPMTRSRPRCCAHSSDDMPERDVVADLAAADRFLAGRQTMLDVVAGAAEAAASTTAAANILEMGRQRVGGRLSAARGDLRCAGFPRAERHQRPERLHRPRHRLPAGGRALAGNPAHPPGSNRRARSSPTASARRSAKLVEIGPCAARRAARGDRRRRAGLRHGADPDDRRPGARRRAGGDPDRRGRGRADRRGS